MKQAGILIIFFLLAFQCSEALSHVPKGTRQLLLDEDVLTVDDVANHLMLHVLKDKYRDQFEDSQSRFFLKEFKEIRREKDMAEVFYVVLDAVESRRFEDSTVFRRNKEGIWINTEVPDKEVIKYEKESAYYYRKLVVPPLKLMVLVGLVYLIRKLYNQFVRF
jgi:hypothetical protein